MYRTDENDNQNPPKWINRILRSFCAPHLLEEIQGDLTEFYHLWVQKHGIRKAKWLYVIHAIKFFRPFVLKRKTSSYPKNYNMMLNNYLTVTVRNLMKHRRFTTLNLTGLTLGISGAMIIFLIVQFELSFDTFHSNSDSIYRVITGRPGDIGDASTPHGTITVLKEEFSEIDKIAVAHKPNPDKTQLEINRELTREQQVYYVTPSFFEIFNFEWIAGTPHKSLSMPGQVVLDEALAQKYFDGDAIGKQIRLDNQFDLVVTGVIKNAPKNTDFPIRMAISHATFENSPRFRKNYNSSYGSFYHTYVLLRQGVDPADLEERFPAMVGKYLGEEAAEKYIAHGLQPLNDIHFNVRSGGGNFTKRSIAHETINSMALIGIFLLVTACINFVNLATAQTIKRSKEVGIRKVLGGSRQQLLRQFISETFIITFLALCLSFCLTYLLLPLIASYLSIPIDLAMLFRVDTVVFMLVVGLLVGLFSGFYPAIALSRFKPIDTITNSLHSPQAGGSGLRKALVVLQFSISQVLIICTIVVISQLRYFNSESLGFNKEAVVTVDLPESDIERLKILRNALSQHTAIKNISFSLNTPAATRNRWWDAFLHSSDPQNRQETENKFIDEHYLPMYDIPLLAGRNLREADSLQVIVNEAFLDQIGIDNPAEGLNETINYWGRPVSIVGVCQNFHSLSLHEKIYPLLLWRNPEFFQKASFRIDLNQAPEAIGEIKHAWKEMFPDNYFTYQFLDEHLATFYRQERKVSRLLSLFAGIAIFIGCLGLYGLVSFIAVNKIKEVGIRKVLGASVSHIVYLFTKDFAWLVGLAFLIATPIGYHLMKQWLEDFAYKIEISWWVFALAALSGFMIAGFTIGFKTIRAALANPVESLRNE